MGKENNSFKVVGTLTDDSGVVWEIVEQSAYGHHALMQPEPEPPKKATPEIIPYITIKGKSYVLLDDVMKLTQRKGRK